MANIKISNGRRPKNASIYLESGCTIVLQTAPGLGIDVSIKNTGSQRIYIQSMQARKKK